MNTRMRAMVKASKAFVKETCMWSPGLRLSHPAFLSVPCADEDGAWSVYRVEALGEGGGRGREVASPWVCGCSRRRAVVPSQGQISERSQVQKSECLSGHEQGHQERESPGRLGRSVVIG